MVDGKGGTILVVEDDAGVARLEQKELERAGYSVLIAGTAEQAMLRLKNEPVDLILLDYYLPGETTGLRLYQQIQDAGHKQPVIVVTGSTNESMVVWALRAGVRDFVTKSAAFLNYIPEAVERVLRQIRTERQLAESQARLAGVIESAKDAIIVTEADQRIVLFNPAAEQMFRYESSRALGQPISRFIPKEIQASPNGSGSLTEEGALTHLIRTGNRGMRADGEVFPLEASMSRGEVGGRKLYTAVVRDITRRKQSEAHLRESEERFRNAFDHTNVPMVLTDLDNRFIRANEAFAHMFGYSKAEILKLSMSDITHPDDLPGSLARRRSLLAGEISFFQIEKRYLHKDGRVLWGLTNVSLIRDAEGLPQQYVGQVQDITERKRAEEANAKYIERLRILHEIDKALIAGEGPAAIAAKALVPLRDLLGVPRAVVNLFDLAKGEVEWLAAAGRRRVHVGPGVRYSIRFMGDVEALRNGKPQFMSVDALPPGPEVKALLASGIHAYVVVPMIADGELIGALSFGGGLLPLSAEQMSIAQEVAAQFAIALAQARLHERVKRQAQELEVQIAERKLLEDQFRQAQKMEAIGKLAGGVAHDFNNLLTIIMGYSDLVMTQLRPADPMYGLIEQIHKSGERASHLTRQLLAFSRKQVLQPVVLDLNMLLTDMEKMLRRLIGEDVELKVSGASALWLVKADAGQLEQVVMNIVINARDAMPKGGKITIETANIDLDVAYASQHAGVQPGPYMRLAISDTGCGMNPETKARIFEPFFSTKGDKGTGLGLATVFGIVKQSGGHIEVYSEVGIGTTFKIYLPQYLADESIRLSQPSLVIPRKGTETILLVEDETEVRNLAALILRNQGYTVIEASNGGEALLHCEQSTAPIHLLMTDVVMPKMSGRQLAERLVPLRPAMKVLYLSGYTDDAILQHGVLEADKAFLNKPFSGDVLTRKVREVLDQK